MDVPVYRSVSSTSEPELMLTLAGCTSQLRSVRVGSRRGLTGQVVTGDVGGARAVQAVFEVQQGQRIRNPLVWLVVDGVWVRVRHFLWGWGKTGPSSRPQIGCSQLWTTGSVVEGAAGKARTVGLVLVEPSPPRPWKDWVAVEREQALADWEAQAHVV